MEADLGKIVALQRELNIRSARENLWAFCCLISPDFYKADRWHLWLICEVLQALYERRLTKQSFMALCISPNVPKWYAGTIDWDRLDDNTIYTKLMLNMPPRHGKSRTIVNFCDWVLGRDSQNKIITVSYNNDLATDMSRYVRDGIMMKKNIPTQIVYSDIFPNTQIAKGNSSFMKWALEGCFFNYLGAGLEGTLTGRGANCVLGNTMVATNKGEVKIEQICSNKDGYLVLSLDLKSGKLVYRKIITTRRTIANELVKFTTKSGREITCTKEHRFFDGRRFKFAFDFREGDYFYTVKKQEEQEMRSVWEGERRQRPDVCGLLRKVEETADKNKVRPLRTDVLQANARLQQSNLKEQNGEDILLTGLCEFSSKNSKTKKMPCVWGRTKTRKEILFSKMSSNWRNRNKKKIGRCNMLDVWEDIQTDKPFNKILLKRLCKQSPLSKNDRRRKLRLQRWTELCKRISGNAKGYIRKRQPYLCSLRKDRKKDDCYVERKGHTENKPYMPPHRQGRYKQFIDQSNNSLQQMPPTYSQIERDEIIEIERISGISQYVYDIQVEETRNFFACALLTHNCTIIDDPIKNAEESYNDRVLEDLWNWYTGTFLSRSEKEGQGSIDIINHTRWNTKDLCGRIMNSKMGNKWLQLSIPVEYMGNLLCPSILPKSDFYELKENMDPNIFRANYYQEPIDIKGRLFEQILTYDTLPDGIEKFIAYCDTADEGKDYLACIMGGVKEGEGYITDIYFTQESMQITEPETAKRLVENKINDAKIESNNGGKGFARNVEKNIWDKYKTRQVNITWFHQTENKMARILTGATFVMKHVRFPEGWEKRWPEFYLSIMSFQKAGGNKHDDGAEALVEWGKMISGEGSINSFMDYMKSLLKKDDKKIT